MWNRLVAPAAALLILCAASVVRAQDAADQVATIEVEVVTTAMADPDPLEQVWKYLETATLEGPSRELLALNGLRTGKLDAGYRKEFDAVLKKTAIIWRVPQVVQMIPGKPQEFAIGPTLTDRTIFVWKTLDSLIGRRFARIQQGLAVTTQPDANQRCQVSVVPLLRYGEALTESFDLQFLTTTASLQSGQSIVVMPTAGEPTGLGAIFFRGLEKRVRQRTFVVITLGSVHRTENR